MSGHVTLFSCWLFWIYSLILVFANWLKVREFDLGAGKEKRKLAIEILAISRKDHGIVYAEQTVTCSEICDMF